MLKRDLLRPSHIRPPETILEDDERVSENKENDAKDYATFLKVKQRKVGPDGFVDSSRFQHAFVAKKIRTKNAETAEKKSSLSVLDLLSKLDKDKLDHANRIKLIEDHMWQHKQEERALKRIEGDIIKHQHTIRKSLRDYENAISRKKLSEEKNINRSLQGHNEGQRLFQTEIENITKQGSEITIDLQHNQKDQGRQLQLITNRIAHQYQKKIEELKQKREELDRLGEEFENKLRRKENEQLCVKQELADLAIQLNMEAQKGRDEKQKLIKKEKDQTIKGVSNVSKIEKKIANSVSKNDVKMRNFEQTKRQLDLDLAKTKGQISTKQREEERRKKDVENLLRNNVTEQKMLNDAVKSAQQEIKMQQLQHSIEQHVNRKSTKAQTEQLVKKEKSVMRETEGAQKARRQLVEEKRREHEDHLRHFHKIVVLAEEKEDELFKKVRSCEYGRQQQEVAVRRLQQQATEARQRNKVKLRNDAIECDREERELEHTLQREKAKLAKLTAQREEKFSVLQSQRMKLREDRYILSEHEREHERLLRLGQSNATITA